MLKHSNTIMDGLYEYGHFYELPSIHFTDINNYINGIDGITINYQKKTDKTELIHAAQFWASIAKTKDIPIATIVFADGESQSIRNEVKKLVDRIFMNVVDNNKFMIPKNKFYDKYEEYLKVKQEIECDSPYRTSQMSFTGKFKNIVGSNVNYYEMYKTWDKERISPLMIRVDNNRNLVWDKII